jgi:hypothetical protein
LDKLDYAPAKLEMRDRAIFVEGKSDFYILSYFHHIKLDRTDHIYMPSSGAHDLGPLIALYLGWGREFIILLDGEREGIRARTRYLDEYGLPESKIILLPEAAGDREIINIENVLTISDLQLISVHFVVSGKPSKKHIMRYFQEKLASREDVAFSTRFIDLMGKISRVLRHRAGIKD